MNYAVHMNYEILLLARLTSFLPRKSNAQLAGLILGQIHHCTEKNYSQMPKVCPPVGGPGRGVGGFGIEWYIIIKYKEKNLDTPNFIRATIFCPLAFRLIEFQLYNYALNIDEACLIDMARFFCVCMDRHKIKVNDSPHPPRPAKKNNE